MRVLGLFFQYVANQKRLAQAAVGFLLGLLGLELIVSFGEIGIFLFYTEILFLLFTFCCFLRFLLADFTDDCTVHIF